MPDDVDATEKLGYLLSNIISLKKSELKNKEVNLNLIGPLLKNAYIY